MRENKFRKIQYLEELTIVNSKKYIAKINMPHFGTYIVVTECENDEEFIGIITNFTNIQKGT